MDADVITIENSRSNEKLLSVFREGVVYGAGIGPGVYDIHSPRVPGFEEMADRARKVRNCSCSVFHVSQHSRLWFRYVGLILLLRRRVNYTSWQSRRERIFLSHLT
jgi:5-methyltetrahydropteroyltriglutamate--homocysteine methyltransferase